MSKVALITGITGQDGSYLAEFLLEKGYEVHGITRRASISNTARIDHLMGKIKLHDGDLSDSSSLIRIIGLTQPDEIYNLAAQSHVQVSFDVPEFTADVDATGVLRVLEAVRLCGLADTCRVYQASTSELYGKVEEVPQRETTPFHPYSPYAVAEHTMGLLLCLNRKIHKAYNRTRDFNFTLNGLTGFDLHGKTVGVIGTGRIGQIFMNICKGFGMEVLAYDPYPANDPSIHYVDLHTLFQQSDILSLHCPLTEQSKHLINKDTIADMKDGVVLLNTSRGMLIESEALLSALQSGKIAAAGLDVYEEETAFFFEDFSENIHRDQVLSLLLSMPNVLLTSHQAFLTNEALKNIAEVTLQNLADFFDGKPLQNEVKTGQL